MCEESQEEEEGSEEAEEEKEDCEDGDEEDSRDSDSEEESEEEEQEKPRRIGWHSLLAPRGPEVWVTVGEPPAGAPAEDPVDVGAGGDSPAEGVAAGAGVEIPEAERRGLEEDGVAAGAGVEIPEAEPSTDEEHDSLHFATFILPPPIWNS